MSVQENHEMVGRVLRASTTGFDCGTRGSHINERYVFGSFVKVPIAEDYSSYAIGLIYAIRIEDDPLARELVMAAVVDNSALLDQRENRMVPVEIAVINVGYTQGANIIQALQPRPPLSLSEVQLCSPEEIYYFTRRSDYFRVVLGASEVDRHRRTGPDDQAVREDGGADRRVMDRLGRRASCPEVALGTVVG